MKKKLVSMFTVAMASSMLIMPMNALAAETTDSYEPPVAIEASLTTDSEYDEDEIETIGIGWPKYICNGNNVNVRSGPGTDYVSLHNIYYKR